MHFNDKGQMNGYIGNDNRGKNERRTDTGGTNYTYRDFQLPHLWHKGPSSSIPEHPYDHFQAAWEFATARGTEH